jgi:hypothetical protein
MVEENINESSLAGSKMVKATAERRRAPNYLHCYANNVQIESTLWDINMIFGEVQEVFPDEPKIVVQDLVSVVMTPEHAKAMCMTLVQHLKTYEQNYGKIRFPPTPGSNPEPTASE